MAGADAKMILITIAIGAIVGWLAAMVVRGFSLGLLWNILVGIAGGFFGAWLLRVAGLSLGGGIVGALLTGLLGAVVILLIAGLITVRVRRR